MKNKTLKIFFKNLPYKKWSRSIRKKVERERLSYNKNLITLASSAILLTFTILQITSISESLWKVKTSWIFFAASIVCGVLAHWLIIQEDIYWHNSMNIKGKEDKLDELPAEKLDDFVHASLGSVRISGFSYFLEIIQLLAFLVALVFLVSFMFFNI